LLPAFGAWAASDIFEQLTERLPGQMRTKKGEVSYRAPQKNEQPAREPQPLDFGDALRTHALSRAFVAITNGTDLYLDQMTRLVIVGAASRSNFPAFNIPEGRARSISRGGPASTPFQTPQLVGINNGTEFMVEVEPGRTIVTIFDGEAELSNADTPQPVRVRSGQQGIAVMGKPIEVRAVIEAKKVVQWWIYYPGILDPAELGLTPAEGTQLAASLDAYRSGDLPGALRQYPGYPEPAEPRSEAQRLYLASLLLSVGAVDDAEARLSQVNSNAPLAHALRTMIDAVQTPVVAQVKRLSPPNSTFDIRPSSFTNASELLAISYAHQATNNLKGALATARAAVARSPNFGFGWARVAELEFSFGRAAEAERALDKAIELSPRNAQAFALKGFLLAAKNRRKEAIEWFDRAIATDAALGNAWLGRGLCRIHDGDAPGGREDLLVAAALEPQRAVLRSYVGKAYANTGDFVHADKELQVARKLDVNDPTSWLYSALLKQQQNRVNEAVRDLERSVELNDNRSLFRSRMLLDQDRAVRGANLASVYRDAGMDDVSVREASRAVNYDYGNYSAHLFLANSYNQLRDPQQINLRYETPWLSEYLIANLLAPVGAGTLSQTVSQQEYSKLFERDRFGVASSTEYLSRGDWLEAGSVFGNSGNLGYAVDTFYISANGQRPNNDQEQLTVSLQLKYDFTPQDSVFFQMIYYDAEAGDLAQYYDPASARLDLRTTENQEPLLLAGYRHEWSPGIQTLVVAGRFDDDYTVTDTSQPVLLLAKNGAGQVIAAPTPALPTASLDYRSQLEMYSAELQQVFQKNEHTLVFGARYQTADFDTDSDLGASTPTQLASLTATTALSFATSPFSQSAGTDFERISGYGYYYWRVLDPLQLYAGLSYDYLSFPQNHRSPPVSSAEDSEDQLSPKAGFTWTPWRDTVTRFAYTRSLGGVSFDQSVRLEPSQVAGFNQAFRSIIPESVAGSTAGAKFETLGLSFEQKFKTGTYLGLEGQLLNSDADRTIGAVDLFFPPTYVASSTRQNLDYQEQTLIFTMNQLLGDGWSLGTRYQLTLSELETVYPDIPDTVTSANRTEDEALLHQLSLFALYNHRCGFFARAESNWYSQDNRGDSSALADDQFWQVSLFAGYRFWRRHAQVQVGVLNLTDQDYRLNPLNLYRDLPRERTFFASMQFNF